MCGRHGSWPKQLSFGKTARAVSANAKAWYSNWHVAYFRPCGVDMDFHRGLIQALGAVGQI